MQASIIPRAAKSQFPFPVDWPRPGPIDLELHDRPHRSSAIEWWYLNCHLDTARGPQSLFVAFFRQAANRHEQTGAVEYAHWITWALSDPDEGRYYASTRVDQSAPRLGLERIDRGEGAKDPRINRAMREVLSRGAVPLPDRMFDRAPIVHTDELYLDFDGNRLVREKDGSYRLILVDRRQKIGADLVFRPQKPPARHGQNGVVSGVQDEVMFYYFIPRCRVEGSLTLAGAPLAVERGSGWYDHEFGFVPERSAEKPPSERPGKKSGRWQKVSWNWIAVQLSDGTDVTAFAQFRVDDGTLLATHAVLCDPSGVARPLRDAAFVPLDAWRSTRTFFEYPTAWTLRSADARLSLDARAAFRDQEVVTLVAKPAFWEGRMKVTGTMDGRPVTGLAWVERSGFDPFDDLDDFFAAVGQEVRRSVAEILSLDPTPDHLTELVCSADRPELVEGVDAGRYVDSLIRPVREIIDRGGKSWRSYAALACVDVVGGDSRRFVQWLAMPELLHVGSLIVDDVEDRSTVRRGGPSCHVVHGEPIAINAGTAAYFLTEYPMMSADLSAENKLRIYSLFFEAMRAGHAGQALDLSGVDPFVPAVVQTGDARSLEQRVLAVHRLKTAAPVGALAKMGAIAGGGTKEQIDGLGSFFEATGLAFQIVDDVLNVRGFRRDLKARGEDISHGKVTLPIVKAMAVLPPAKRAWLWERLRMRSHDSDHVAAVTGVLEECGALQACNAQARALIEAAWERLDPLVEDSIPKVMLRAFSWYVLDRQY